MIAALLVANLAVVLGFGAYFAHGLHRAGVNATVAVNNACAVFDAAMLRTVVEGRETAPTDTEAGLHAIAGGRWLISHDHDGERLVYVLDAGAADAIAEAHSTRNGAVTWWALDAHGRPTTWPRTPR